ncbi:uncharacterized protein LOC142950716 [Anarhichas minor]|uniref:uncharacterized protein LOC142950716 n=1 Tax=Anarhichas minor TaxID=65739 RepID=UPI003F73C3CF
MPHIDHQTSHRLERRCLLRGLKLNLFLLRSMASQRTVCGQTNKAPLKSGGQPGQTLRRNTLVEAEPHVAASFRLNPPNHRAVRKQEIQRVKKLWCLNVSPGNAPENSIIVREAQRMDLPHHLVLGNVRHRVQTHGANYTDMKELVADLFAANDDGSRSRKNQEVPMETNQLEEALMMSSPVVWKALRMGAPPHLIKILSNRVGYADVSELLTDLNMKQRLLTYQ